MKQQITLNETVKEAVTTALIQMMTKKPIGEIQIKDLAKAAGVSRSSFYRNFDSKEDVLIKHINNIYSDYFSDKNISANINDYDSSRDFLVERFRFVKRNKDFFIALNKNNLVDHAFSQINDTNMAELYIITEEDSIRRRYITAKAVGATSGIIIEWIKSGFKETENELAEIFKNDI